MPTTHDEHEIFVNYVPKRRHGLPKNEPDELEEDWEVREVNHEDDHWTNEFYSDEDVYDSEGNEYLFIDRAERNNPDQYDIFIRQPSRECDTILEEDEENLSEWYSTKTSAGARSVADHGGQGGSHPGHRGRQGSFARSDSPMKIVEFHPSQVGESQTDSAGDSSLRYPHYKMIKRQKMLLPFEISSDLSEEARLVDEIRNIGLKDEGRLTYAEMLMAFRRSQGIRRSTASSHDLTDSDTDDVTTDDSSHDIIDYLPPQTQHTTPPKTSSPNTIHQSEIELPRTNRSEDNVYIKHASGGSIASSTHRQHPNNPKKSRISGGRKISQRLAQPRPLYNQANFGPYRSVRAIARNSNRNSSKFLKSRSALESHSASQTTQFIPQTYQSFPSYPRYRQPRRPPPPTNWPLYFLLAFLLLGLMLISFIPLIF